jgi:hypothetical protein
MWVALIVLGAVVIFVFGFMVGETAETQVSKQRDKRQAARARMFRAWQREIDATLREIDVMNRAPLDQRVGDLHLVDLKPPTPLGHDAERGGDD